MIRTKDVVIISCIVVFLCGFMYFGYLSCRKTSNETFSMLAAIDKQEQDNLKSLKGEERKRVQERINAGNKIREENKRFRDYKRKEAEEKREKELAIEKEREKIRLEKERAEMVVLMEKIKKQKEKIKTEIVRIMENKDIEYINLRVPMYETIFDYIRENTKYMEVKQHIKGGKYILFRIKEMEFMHDTFALELAENDKIFDKLADGEEGFCLMEKTDKLYKYDNVGEPSDQIRGVMTVRIWKAINIDNLVNNIYDIVNNN